ncbi:MAG: hypothetical protein OXB88_04045 [Bacteriovoracales bacterium]|nr:hypothetical protein [Bacteriovoracales bacterium]
MKSSVVKGAFILFISILMTGCGRKKTPSYGGGFYGGGSGNYSQLVAGIPCRGANPMGRPYGPGKIVARLKGSGTSHNGYRSVYPDRPDFMPGHWDHGGVTGTYAGADTMGNVIVIHQMSNGMAAIELHLCMEEGLIMEGRQITQARIRQGNRIVTKARPNCHVNEVTAANLDIQFGPYHYLQPVTVPFAFTRLEDTVPGSCNRQF